MSQTRRWTIGILVAIVIASSAIATIGLPGNRVHSNLHGDNGPLAVTGVSLSRRSVARFQGDGKAATVQLGKQTAHVTIDVVELPDGRKVNILPGCKSVELRESRQGMRVFLDGIESQPEPNYP